MEFLFKPDQNNHHIPHDLGDKALSRLRLLELKLPSPPWFAILPSLVESILDYNKLVSKWSGYFHSVHIEDYEQLSQIAKRCHIDLQTAQIPELIVTQITQAISSLPNGWLHLSISPHSHNVLPTNYPITPLKGEISVLDAYREIMASQITPHSLYLFLQKNSPVSAFPFPCVVVSRFDNIQVSGKISPLNQKLHLQIKAINGANPTTHSYDIEPETWTVDLSNKNILSHHLPHQPHLVEINHYGQYQTRINHLHHSKLNDSQINTLISYYQKISNHLRQPINLHFQIADNKINLTRYYRTPDSLQTSILKGEHSPVGISLSPGIAIAKLELFNATHNTNPGTIICLKTIEVSLLPKLKTAAGLIIASQVTNPSLRLTLSHLGIPVITNVNLDIVKFGLVYELNANLGTIKPYKNLPASSSSNISFIPKANHPTFLSKLSLIAIPSKLSDHDQDSCFSSTAWFKANKHHPHYQSGKIFKSLKKDLITAVSNGSRFYKSFDLNLKLAKSLNGGKEHLGHDFANLIGPLGASYVIADPTVFELELTQIKGLSKSVNLITPLIRTQSEYLYIKKLLNKYKLIKYLPLIGTIGSLYELPLHTFETGIVIDLALLISTMSAKEPTDSMELAQIISSPSISKLLSPLIDLTVKKYFYLPHLEPSSNLIQSLSIYNPTGLIISHQYYSGYQTLLDHN